MQFCCKYYYQIFLDHLLKNQQLSAILEYLQPQNLPKTFAELQQEIDRCREQFYRRLIEIAHDTFAEIEGDDSEASYQQRRAMAVLAFDDSRDKRNLLHIAAIMGDDVLLSQLLLWANDIELDTSALDAYGFCAMQYSFGHQNQIILDIFLNAFCSHIPLKDLNGKPLLETMPRINSLDDIQVLEQHPYGKLAFHNYIHNFYSVEKLLEKMHWLHNLEIGLAPVLLLQDHQDKDIRLMANEFINLHNRAVRIRSELMIAIGYQDSKEAPTTNNTWCVTKQEFQQLMEQALAQNLPAESLQYVPCVDDLQDQFTHLLRDVEKMIHTKSLENKGQELPAISALIRLNLACLQGIVVYVLTEKIIDRFYRSLNVVYLQHWESEWQKNKEKAALELKSSAVKNARTAIYNLLETTLQKFQYKDNYVKIVGSYLEPLLYAADNKRLKAHLQKLEQGCAMFPAVPMLKWHEIQPNLALVLAETSLADRKTRSFGPLIAKYYIKLFLNEARPTFSENAIHCCYQALISSSADIAKQFLAQAQGMHFLDPRFTEAVLLQVGAREKYERVAAFKEFSPGTEIATTLSYTNT